MSNTQLAYLAGIIDGEGNIGIQQIKLERGYKGERNKRYNDYFKISNTDRNLIDWIHSNFGGCISEDDRGGNRKKCFSIRFVSNKAESILRQVYPYLVIKKEQADIIFRFRETYRKYFVRKFGLPEKIRLEREELYEKLKQLHSRRF